MTGWSPASSSLGSIRWRSPAEHPHRDKWAAVAASRAQCAIGTGQRICRAASEIAAKQRAWRQQTIDNKLRPLPGPATTWRKLLKSAWNTLPARIQTLLQSSTGEWVDQLKNSRKYCAKKLRIMMIMPFGLSLIILSLSYAAFSAVDKMLLELSGKIGNDGREFMANSKAMV